MPIYHGPGGAGDSTDDATITAVATLASQAATSAANAATSETNAETAATNAATSATNASTAVSQAQGYANTAASSATTAANSATTAQTYSSNASASASTASSKATEASTSASQAATSAGNAATSASQAATSATNAASSASSASTNAASALAIYGNTTAMNNAVTAAATSATNAASSASTATTQATNASTSATNAAASAASALTYSNNAQTSASNALSSANSASASATTATTQANLAAYYASNTGSIYGSLEAVQAAATSASTSASTATTQATNAATSATQAAASAASASAVSLANEPTRHSIRPSLLLDFANTKTLDPRITFTRASTATFYDGKTVAKAEENLLKYSQEFDNGAWIKQGITLTANSGIAPDGTTTAELFTEDGTNNSHRVYQAYSSNVSPHFVSVFAKYVSRQWIYIRIKNSGNVNRHAWFDIQNGLVGTVESSLTASIQSVGNGWYRCIVEISNAFASDNVIFSGSSADNDSLTYTGSSAFLLWGAQYEQRSSVTAYTPTTTAPITNYIPALQTAAANVARFEHNPTTGESLGLEIEEQRTNLLTYSEDFTNATGGWINSNSSILRNVAIAPDGTLTANRLVANTVSTAHSFSKVMSSSITTGQRYTASIFVKKDNAERYLRLAFSGTIFASASVYFDLDTGTFSNLGGTNAAASITSVGNGWYRVSLSADATASGSASAIFYSYTAIGTAASGNDFSGNLFWGAQAELASFATSYIPTVASQVTRSKDFADITGTNFSSWYNTAEGSAYVDAMFIGHQLADVVYSIDNGSTASDYSLYCYWNNTNNTMRVDTALGLVTQSALVLADVAVNTPFKIAGAYKTNDFAASENAGVVQTDVSGNVPSNIARLRFGISGNTTNDSSMTIKKFAYYPKRLTNSELQGLTTV